MSARSFDVIVIGVGAMGAAACWQLATRGARVLGLEQFDIPHALGSSTGFSRMIRMAYYEHPDYVPLLRRAYALWHALEEASGEKLLHLTGGLYIGPPEGGLVAGSLASARQHQLAHELLDSGELARQFPQFQMPGDWVAVHEEMAGFLLPEKAIAAFARAALLASADLRAREPVLQWSADEKGVSVRTSSAEYRAQHLIFCGGAWTSHLLKNLSLGLRVTRQVMGWVWPRKPEIFELGAFPVFAIDNPDGSLHYGFPMSRDVPGFKIAHHAPGAPADPDYVERGPLPGDEATFRPALARFLPDADGPLLALRTCLYTNSPDQHFIIDRHAEHERVTIACGFSGHGFKFASVIGEALADLATRGGTELPIRFLSLGRSGLAQNR